MESGIETAPGITRLALLLAGFFICMVQLKSCFPLGLIDPPGITLNREADTVVFAVIGDYGKEGQGEGDVADMVLGWDPDFIITTGDNNYNSGNYETLSENIGQYYGEFIFNYDAPEPYQCLGEAFADSINRFFPSPGNHDGAGPRGLKPYLNYFTLPGREEYYTFTWGEVVFFSINSLPHADLETEKVWLEKALSEVKDKFTIVYFHHPPYSPGSHGDTKYMQWDFFHWGVDVVLSGHDHIYARLEKPGEEGLHYLINGLGGNSIYTCDGELMDPGISQVVCYHDNFGAMRCLVTPNSLEMVFHSIVDPASPVDRILLKK